MSPQDLRERLVSGGFLEQPRSLHAAIRDAKNHPTRSERCCSAQPQSKVPIREYRTCPTFFATGVNVSRGCRPLHLGRMGCESTNACKRLTHSSELLCKVRASEVRPYFLRSSATASRAGIHGLSSFDAGKTLLDRVNRIRLFLIRLIFGIPAGNHLANRGNGLVGEPLVNEALECMQVLCAFSAR